MAKHLQYDRALVGCRKGELYRIVNLPRRGECFVPRERGDWMPRGGRAPAGKHDADRISKPDELRDSCLFQSLLNHCLDARYKAPRRELTGARLLQRSSERWQ